MSHMQVWKLFKLVYPGKIDDQVIWYPCGRNCIRVRGIKDFCASGGDLIFTASNDHRSWRLETVDQFLESKKGDKK